MLTRFSVGAAAAWIRRPVSPDPVKLIESTSGCSTSAAPATSPMPCTTLTTPGGMPASRHSRAVTMAASGVCSAGFSTTELPQASAGTMPATAADGPFQGVMTAHTPTGSRTSWTITSGGQAGVEPCSLVGQPE